MFIFRMNRPGICYAGAFTVLLIRISLEAVMPLNSSPRRCPSLLPVLVAVFLLLLLPLPLAFAQAKPVPRVQVVPLPRGEASMQIGGREVTRFYFDKQQERPFLYPIIGPSGRSLTRMGHPHDPVGHSHHNSIWLSHEKIDGINFWSDQRIGIIETQRILRYTDGEDAASIFALNHWKATGLGKDKEGQPHQQRIVLIERRLITLEPLPNGESLITIDVQLHSPANRKEPVTIEQSPFGLIGVRMAKTIGIHDGGGTIRNSEGQTDEQGDTGCFRKPAKWCDYSGPIETNRIEGITLLDHPANFNHPAPFHVRADGWMGACLTLDKPIQITPDKPLRLRYGLYVHRDLLSREAIHKQWETFAGRKVEALPEK